MDRFPGVNSPIENLAFIKIAKNRETIERRFRTAVVKQAIRKAAVDYGWGITGRNLPKRLFRWIVALKEHLPFFKNILVSIQFGF